MGLLGPGTRQRASRAGGLFPYARQALGDLVAHGGFPPFLLQPINFEAVYAEQVRRRMEQAQQPAVGNA